MWESWLRLERRTIETRQLAMIGMEGTTNSRVTKMKWRTGNLGVGAVKEYANRIV